MPRRRRTFAQGLRSLVLELVALAVFILVMLGIVMPWGMNAIVDAYRSSLPTPYATISAEPSN